MRFFLNKRVLKLSSIAFAILFFISSNTYAINVLFDTETYNVLNTMFAPLKHHSSLNYVKFYLVSDTTENAFVPDNRRVFITTELLLEEADPTTIMGVYAHELGHIKHNDIVLGNIRAMQLRKNSIIGFILLAGASLLSQNASGVVASAGLSSQVFTRSLLSYSRSQEASADVFAVKIMNDSHIPLQGLYNFLVKLRNNNAPVNNPYLQSHPVLDSRINYLASQIAISPYSNLKFSPVITAKYQRIRKKLRAYIQPNFALKNFKTQDTDDIYARAVAMLSIGKLQASLKEANVVMTREPKNPFFMELLGEINSTIGNFTAAKNWFKKSLKVNPNNSYIRISLANTLLRLKMPKKALIQLDKVNIFYPPIPIIWLLYTMAYNDLGQKGNLFYANARYQFISGNCKNSLKNIKQAEKYPLKQQQLLILRDITSLCKK